MIPSPYAPAEQTAKIKMTSWEIVCAYRKGKRVMSGRHSECAGCYDLKLQVRDILVRVIQTAENSSTEGKQWQGKTVLILWWGNM